MKFPAIKGKNHKHFNGWLGLIGLLLLVAFHLTGLIPYQDRLRVMAFDLYQNYSPRERISAPVVIVEVDEKSLSQLGQWPWPRSLMARLIEAVNAQQPAAIAMDIIMPEEDRSSPCQVAAYIPGIDPRLIDQVCQFPSNDDLLADALRAAPVTLGVAGIDQDGPSVEQATPVRVVGPDPLPYVRQFHSVLKNIPQLQQAAQGQAILSTDIERGIVRRVPMVAAIDEQLMPSLSLEVIRLAIGSPVVDVYVGDTGIQGVGVGDLQVPTLEDGSVWVHYSPHSPERFVSAVDLLQGNLDDGLLERKLVLIGFTGLGLVDFPSTVLGERVPGVEIHAQVLESIFDGTVLARPDWALWLEALMIFALGSAVIYGFPYVKAGLQVPGLIVIIALLAYGGGQAYAYGLLRIDVASPALVFVMLYGAMLADSLIWEEQQIGALEDDLRAQREAAAKIQGEMEAAKRFQMGIVPDARAVFSQEPRLDIAAMMEPAKMVGGDLYDCFMLDEHHVFFSLGDVCGKGVPASLFMVISKTLCKSVALREGADYSDLGKLLSQANLEISRDNPEMLFVTAFVGILDLRTGQLTYCNAGHERPLLLAPRCRIRELEGASGPPVSVMDEFEYQTFHYQMAQSEALCIFSDGLTEAANIHDELYGQQRLIDTLDGLDEHWDSTRVIQAMTKSVRAHVKEAEPSDDLTLMVVRWNGPHSKP